MDFSSLVLAPGMNAFARVCTFYPRVSQASTVSADNPNGAPYVGRGVYSSRPVDVQMQDGTIFSDQETSLGIRLAEFPVAPEIGDRIKVDGIDGLYWVGDVDTDGQGGATILLRNTAPQETP
ncbi:head-tail joining protein [Bradyrhizobium sp. 2S1]|uniref:head-tail joining protein n=1 Tax=Bradyrhizobium sp. 2S1 TaxID=1404429 RepID=UPI00140B8DE1|nr:hypothetical protein [Bradyrhizobium sp. 2S1]MCK7672388.1 hypothetical protein [Bradyrhizobium sp. 2S1]